MAGPGPAASGPRAEALLQLKADLNGSPRVATVNTLGSAVNRTGLPGRLRAGIESPSGISVDDVQGVQSAPDSGVVQRMPVAQLNISTQQRAVKSTPFLNNRARLQVGYLTAPSNLRDNARDKQGAAAPAGTMIVFDGAIRDNFSVWLTTVEKDHVYGMVVSNAAGVPIVDPQQWRKGWIVYENVDTDNARSGALRAQAGANAQQAIVAYLGTLGGVAAPRNPRTRTEMAPRAIKAWAEKTGTDLGAAMPLQNQQALHGRDFHAALAADANANYATIDPNGDLGLSRLDPANQLFLNFAAFLNLNARTMPGTLAKDHELRDESVGGARAQLGRAWLAQAGIQDGPNDNRPDIVAITGANVTNIFINSRAPTWAAFDANVQHLVQNHMQPPQQQGGQVVPAPPPAFTPWHTLHNQAGQLGAFIQGFTQPRPGEHYLFHGTSRANVASISKTGFDPEFVNYTFPKGYGKTGYGTAFTDQFAKALAYAPPEAVPQAMGGPIYKHYVIIARVFVGKAYDVGDEARRTRGNLELTESNLNYEEARGNKMKAQGEGKVFLGQSSSTVRERLDRNPPEHLHSTYQHRDFDLTLDAAPNQGLQQQQLHYRDTSVTVSDAIQMYPMFIVEADIPQANIRTGRRA